MVPRSWLSITQSSTARSIATFQYFFNERKADVGVEIVPTYGLHRQMSTGVAYGEQLIFDIERLRRHFPAVPVKVILIDS